MAPRKNPVVKDDAKGAEGELANLKGEGKVPAPKQTTLLTPSEPESPWHKVDDQSDKDTTIEACNIATGYQMPKAVLIRCKVDGKVFGDVKIMSGVTLKKLEGNWKLC